jgi:hypothetical protein
VNLGFQGEKPCLKKCQKYEIQQRKTLNDPLGHQVQNVQRGRDFGLAGSNFRMQLAHFSEQIFRGIS